MATLDIPHDCRCSWVVVQSGVGWNCRSRLKIMNALCLHIRDHQRSRRCQGGTQRCGTPGARHDRRRRLLLFAACAGVGFAIGWKWGAPERQQEYADSLRRQR